MTERIQAVYRPRTGDIRIIRRDGQFFDVPAEDALDLGIALGQAMAVPPLADALCVENCWSAR